jgi:filamentous hemagglutinin family protein
MNRTKTVKKSIIRTHICYLINLLAFFLIINSSAAHAEITTDGTLGAATSLAGPNYLISHDLGTLRGGNLFHSFSAFNIGSGERGTFTGPNTVSAIISRVTGGQASSINGILRSDIPGADLFFFNPAGVVFGEGAALEIDGSFHVSTADYLKLSDGGRFSATHPHDSLLTSAPPSAFGYIGNDPAGINIGSELQVPDGKTLSVVGGDIELNEGLVGTFGGRVNMAAVSSAGEIPIADMNTNTFEKLGDIEFKENSGVITIGSGGGDIYIRSGQLTIDNSKLLAGTNGEEDGGKIDILVRDTVSVKNNGLIDGTTMGAGRGTDIDIQAATVRIDAGSISSGSTGGGISADIDVVADKLEMFSGATIFGYLTGSGHGGNIHLAAREEINLDGGALLQGNLGDGDFGRTHIETSFLHITNGGNITSLATARGSGPKYTLNLESLEIENGGNIKCYNIGSGPGTNLSITANESIQLFGPEGGEGGIYCQSNTGSTATAKAGNVEITTPNFLIGAHGILNAMVSEGEGAGGDVTLNIGEALTFVDGGLIWFGSMGAGEGGNLLIHADTVGISGGRFVGNDSRWLGSGIAGFNSTSEATPNRMELFARSLDIMDGGSIFSQALGDQAATSLFIHASETVSVSGHSETSTSTIASGASSNGTGAASNMTIDTPYLHLSNEATLNAMTGGAGKGGDIDIRAARVEIESGAGIKSGTLGAGQAGTIKIEATEEISVTGFVEKSTGGIDNSASNLTTLSVGAGKAGDIFLSAPIVSIDGLVNASTLGAGDGGDIDIAADVLNVIGAGTIGSDTMGDGDAGNLSIRVGRLQVLDGGNILTDVIGSWVYPELPPELKALWEAAGQTPSQLTGAGNAGTIRIEATEAVAVSGTDQNGLGSSVSVSTSGSGTGGSLFLSTPELMVKDGASISGMSIGEGTGGDIFVDVGKLDLSGGGMIAATSGAEGDAGEITVNIAESISISGQATDGRRSGIQSRAKGTGAGGNIVIAASGDIRLDERGWISGESTAGGNAGTVRVDAGGRIELSGGSTISTEAITADGGDLTVNAGNWIYLRDSAITTRVGSGMGNGGNIAIGTDLSPEFVILKNSDIIANAYGGNGGNIHITSDQFIADTGSRVQASSELGIDGLVRIDAVDADITRGLVSFSPDYLDISGMLNNRCATRTNENASSLVVTGSGRSSDLAE